MTSYFKLIDAIDTTTTLNVARRVNGVVKYGHVRMDPGKKYELGNDDVFIKSLKNATIEKQYSQALEDKLKSFGIKYEPKMCRACGGKVKKLSYPVVEVIEDGS